MDRLSPIVPVRRWPAAGSMAAPLVCFPYAGGRPAMYRHWARHLGVEVLVPERSGAGPARAGSLAAVADEAAAALVTAGLRRCALFGHSMGAVVAVEVARRLHAEGVTIDRVLVAARMPPGPATAALDEELVAAARRGADVLALLDPRMASLAAALVPTADDRGVLDDLRLLTDHRPDTAPLPVPVHAIAGADDPAGSPEAMGGWNALTEVAFTLDVLPGAHYFVHTSAPRLLNTIARRLG